jgi:hypothetical protein
MSHEKAVERLSRCPSAVEPPRKERLVAETPLYDTIGANYAAYRRLAPRIAVVIHACRCHGGLRTRPECDVGRWSSSHLPDDAVIHGRCLWVMDVRR